MYQTTQLSASKLTRLNRKEILYRIHAEMLPVVSRASLKWVACAYKQSAYGKQQLKQILRY